MSREMFVYSFTMSNLVSVFPYALRYRSREKRINLEFPVIVNMRLLLKRL